MPKVTTILPIGLVNDAPNQIRYQRISALASRYRLIVVTTHPLPSSLSDAVEEVYICSGVVDMWRRCLDVGNKLKAESRPFYIHTQYAPYPLVAGFLCKRRFACPWVYDLWDHPSLTWSSDRGVRRWLKQLIWALVLRNMLKCASAWIIGMHPGILSQLPSPNKNCRIILKGPGVDVGSSMEGYDKRAPANGGEIVICYAGPIIANRGADLILDWAAQYKGSKARLELIGQSDERSEERIARLTGQAQDSNDLRVNLHGWLQHTDVLRILETSDIGICLINPAVLNYRYAYPIKVAEYMSQGLVTVASDGHGVRSMLQHGINGYITNYEFHSFCKTMDEAIIACLDDERKSMLVENAVLTAMAYERKIVNMTMLDEIDAVVVS